MVFEAPLLFSGLSNFAAYFLYKLFSLACYLKRDDFELDLLLLLRLPLESLEALAPLSYQPTLSLFGLVSELRGLPYLERELLLLDDLDECLFLRYCFPL